VVLLIALAIFLFLAWATWAVSAACYGATFAESADLAVDPNRRAASACAVAAVAVTSFLPMPVNFVAALIAWGAAVFGGLSLPRGRAAVLFAYLAAWSAVSRLVVLGVLSALAK
jgi:hypothetical protein